MGKDKETWRRIREERAKEALLMYHIEGIAECLCNTKTSRNLFQIMLTSVLKGLAESADTFESVVQK